MPDRRSVANHGTRADDRVRADYCVALDDGALGRTEPDDTDVFYEKA